MTKWSEFTQWWVALEPELLRATRSKVSREDGQDLVQDLAILAVKNHERFTNREEFRRWAYARLHWLILDQFRAPQNKLRAPTEATQEQSVPPGQEEELIYQDLISKLPEHQQIVLKGMLEGMSNTQIAQRLNIKEPSVRSLLRFARSNLVHLLTIKEVDS